MRKSKIFISALIICLLLTIGCTVDGADNVDDANTVEVTGSEDSTVRDDYVCDENSIGCLHDVDFEFDFAFRINGFDGNQIVYNGEPIALEIEYANGSSTDSTHSCCLSLPTAYYRNTKLTVQSIP